MGDIFDDKPDIKIYIMDLFNKKKLHIEYRNFFGQSYFIYSTNSKHKKLKLGRSIYQGVNGKRLRKNFKYNLNEAPQILLDIFKVSAPAKDITYWAQTVLAGDNNLDSRRKFYRTLLNLLA